MSSSLHILFSGGIHVPNPNKAALKNRNSHSTPRFRVFNPKAMMMDGINSSLVRDVRPPITNFKPSVWGDIFSTFSFDDQLQHMYGEEIEALKKKARSMLMTTAASSTKLLVLIDKLERLGVAYHFETEIEYKLKQVYDDSIEEEDDDLFTTALRFRLLRQHQYHVSCNVFKKFVDKDNKLKESLCSDVEGLLSLYEAAHVRIHDEHILDEAVEFTRHRLNNMLPELESPTIKERVQKALDFSLQKSLTIFNVRFYISMYEKEDDDHEQLVVLRLAKLNFNFLQNIYRNEVFQLTKWWNKLDMISKLAYTRDRVVESYLWGLGHHLEPQYSYVRMEAAKAYQLLTVVDDTYDNYATLEEIHLFNQALERWNMDEIDELPDFLQIVYKFIMSEYKDFEREAEKQGKSFASPYYIKAMKQLGRAYAKEQKWIMEREMPSFEEYMSNAEITAIIYVTFTAVVPGLKTVSKQDLDWLQLTAPTIFLSVAKAGRLLDDLGSHQRESKEGEMVTIVDCYMKDKGVTREEAICAFGEIIEDGWKSVNAEWVKSRGRVPKEMVVQFLNILRMAELTYKNNEDAFTDPHNSFKPLTQALLLDPPYLF